MSTVRLVDSTGKEKEAFNLGVDVSGLEISPRTYACSIRVLLQNWRQGTVACKARSDVSFSNKKPWKQKGTGRARAGSARSPIWRKGGVTFGPSKRVRELGINKKQKKVCFRSLLKAAIDEKRVYCLDGDFSKNKSPKTKAAFDVVKGAGLDKTKGVLFLPYGDIINFSSFRNIPSVSVVSFDQPNAFDLSGAGYWMFLKKDLDLFKNMVLKWM